mmetsp:Transcript_12714/g.19535  ORF Transcript_12714/g.19535 Transcript_12714/m.19535 type:complete len:673 (+) Transcript_12714:117-2135(+)
MGNMPGGMGEGGPPNSNKDNKDGDGEKKKKKRFEPRPSQARQGRRRRRKGPSGLSKTPTITPSSKCKLRLLKLDRVKDFLLMEQEFIRNHEVFKPHEERDQEEREKLEELRGSPLGVGSLEELIDDNHAIVSSSVGPEYYVNILSSVNQDLLDPGSSVLLHNKTMSVVGILQDDSDPMVSVMKVEKAPLESYADIGGLEDQIQEIKEAVELPLAHPELYEDIGIKPPKGVILYGEPGTGKTLLAKAVANQTSATFLRVVGSELIQKYLGDGPKLVRELFRVADDLSPTIVFIDEIDAVGRQRGRGGMGGNDERENTLNQMLVEMDGFSTTTGVVVLAGTNRIDILDQALTRPGRFDRTIQVDKPDLQGRKEIFLVHLNGLTLEDEPEDIAGRLAGLTPGFAGADIANICNEAAIVAARRKGESVTTDDFEKAIDRIIGGLESNKIMSKDEQSIVAYHEAGHAVAGWFLEHADPLMKVTIIPRSSGALGFAQYLPKEVFLRTSDQIMDTVCMALAGRAAEEIFFGRVTTGASDDLRRVTDMVYSTIQIYGMNPRLGQLAFPKDPNAMFDERPYSDATARAMDEEAKRIIDEAYERTLNLLRERKDEVEKVALSLLDKETITHDDIVGLVGPRPFKGDKQYEEFIRAKQKDQSDDDTDEVEGNNKESLLNPSLA